MPSITISKIHPVTKETNPPAEVDWNNPSVRTAKIDEAKEREK